MVFRSFDDFFIILKCVWGGGIKIKNPALLELGLLRTLWLCVMFCSSDGKKGVRARIKVGFGETSVKGSLSRSSLILKKNPNPGVFR